MSDFVKGFFKVDKANDNITIQLCAYIESVPEFKKMLPVFQVTFETQT